MSASWMSGRMCAVDFESSGIDVYTARIVQAAVVDLIPADPGITDAPAFTVDRWSSLVWPGDGFEMPAGAQEVHGLSTERCRDEGIDSAEAVGYVAGKLADVWAAGGIVVGHNIGGYDLALLAAELRRHGQPPLQVGPIVDTLTLERCDLLERKHRFRKGSRKLVDTAPYWGVTLGDLAHDATEDALASARVAWKIARSHAAIANMPINELQTYQAEQHAAWAADFEKWLRKKKADDDAPQEEIDAVSISRDWPIRAELAAPARDEAA